jgi:hypothetical protein
VRPETLLITPLLAAAALAGVGCVKHKVDPIEVTVNVNLRVDEELREFFRYENEIDRQLLEQLRSQRAQPGSTETQP